MSWDWERVSDMGQIFISYKHQPHVVSFIQKLKEQLETANFDVWVDSELLRPGQEWKKEIDNAIKASIALVVIMTPDAFKSQYVTYEWAFAIGRGMEVIPLIFENTEIHPRLNDIQFIDFTNHFDPPWNRLIQRLVEIETGVSGKSREIPPFVKRAVDALDSYERDDRYGAIESLKQSNHPAAVEALANAVSHHLPDVRVNAAIGLAQVTKGKDLRCISGLIEACNYPHHRQASLHFLAEIGTSEAVASLIDLLLNTANSSLVEYELYSALMRVSNPEVSSLFEELLDGKPWPIELTAIKVLVRLGNTNVTTRLINILGNFDDRALSVIETLGEIGDPVAVTPLARILQTPKAVPRK